jgi:hypothetical protein
MRQGVSWSALLLLAACDGEPQAPAGLPAPPVLEHDFGTIAHGQAKVHEFVLDQRAVLGPDFYALAAQADCSCARVELVLRDQRGAERPIVRHDPEFAARPGEVVVARMQVDTATKEAVDLGPVDSHASVVFQRLLGDGGFDRVLWPIRFRFAIDSPVRLRPFAALEFERVPVSGSRELLTTLQSDLPGRKVVFGPVRCEDPRLVLALEPDGERTRLRARFAPADGVVGSFRALVTIGTDLPDGYEVRLAATGKVVPDLEAAPFAKISIRADLRREQPAAAALSQFVIVTDHDRRRPAEFTIARFVDLAGRDASRCFEVRFEPVPGDDRSQRAFLRYLGGAEGEFRGELVLAKDPTAGPFLAIEVVVLPSQRS